MQYVVVDVVIICYNVIIKVVYEVVVEDVDVVDVVDAVHVVED